MVTETKTYSYGMGIRLVLGPSSGLRPSQVRAAINIFKADELPEDVILISIMQADALIDSKANPDALTALVWLAKLRLSAYYAYLTYSDRVFNELAGSHSRTGEWNPIGQALWRETRDKLAAMEKQATKALKDIGIDQEAVGRPLTVPVFGTIR